MIVESALVFKAGQLAGHIDRTPEGSTFTYSADYLKLDMPAIASTLPRTDKPYLNGSGAVPPFFAGLLPEGRRLTALINRLKTSADDELSLVTAVGANTIGDVQVFDAASGASAQPVEPVVSLPRDLVVKSFDRLLEESFGSERIGLPGVQDKISGRMLSLPAKAASDSFILKFDPPEFPQLVENENFFLQLARKAGLKVEQSQLIQDSTGKPALLVTRFDRLGRGLETRSLAVEDASQAMGLWPKDKYLPSAEKAAKALVRLCPAKPAAAGALLAQMVFAWLTVNGDCHAKNISVLEQEDEFEIAPAYDLPSSAFYNLDTNMSLSVMGHRNGISGKIWLDFAEELGLRRPYAERIMRNVLTATEGLDEQIASGFLSFDSQTCKRAAREMKNRRRLTLEGWPAFG